MRLNTILVALTFALSSAVAYADLEPWKDYEVSDAVWSVTTIKVDPKRP